MCNFINPRTTSTTLCSVEAVRLREHKAAAANILTYRKLVGIGFILSNCHFRLKSELSIFCFNTSKLDHLGKGPINQFRDTMQQNYQVHEKAGRK